MLHARTPRTHPGAWDPTRTHTHTYARTEKYAFPRPKLIANAPQYYVRRTLLVFFFCM